MFAQARTSSISIREQLPQAICEAAQQVSHSSGDSGITTPAMNRVISVIPSSSGGQNSATKVAPVRGIQS